MINLNNTSYIFLLEFIISVYNDISCIICIIPWFVSAKTDLFVINIESMRLGNYKVNNRNMLVCVYNYEYK